MPHLADDVGSRWIMPVCTWPVLASRERAAGRRPPDGHVRLSPGSSKRLPSAALFSGSKCIGRLQTEGLPHPLGTRGGRAPRQRPGFFWIPRVAASRAKLTTVGRGTATRPPGGGGTRSAARLVFSFWRARSLCGGLLQKLLLARLDGARGSRGCTGPGGGAVPTPASERWCECTTTND